MQVPFPYTILSILLGLTWILVGITAFALVLNKRTRLLGGLAVVAAYAYSFLYSSMLGYLSLHVAPTTAFFSVLFVLLATIGCAVWVYLILKKKDPRKIFDHTFKQQFKRASSIIFNVLFAWMLLHPILDVLIHH